MSKINQIENALKELDGGAFQKLANSYLLKRGYPQIKPTGSVAGSNKVRKGTPDTLIQTEDGKYIFCEYTTISENKVYSKFYDDLTKCLNENKTGVAISKIKEIVLCCTSDLSIENIDKLSKQCQIEEVNLNLFGLGAISYDLLEKYPSIAKDYLGIEVDTGQIVPLNDFISWHEENKLTTTLETSFHFREEEKSNLLSLINDNSLVIVTGKAGVGKTRIAIECYRQFTKENKKYKAYCIFNRECNLFEDIKSYFSNSGYFLIFVDDANRISGFQYIVQLLQTKRDNQNFKIIVTVRDYALDKIRETCQPIKVSSEINIKPFTNEEIKKLVQEEFEIKNQSYLDRIVSISHGNPRIAVMAAQVAKDSNTFNSIRDVSEIYDKYFSSIKSDLDALKDGAILKVAGIVAFFRSVDITNNNLMSDIGKIFDISAEDFEKASKKLHEMEVLDMFENEVVKISDQVFSTYLFYLVFFKEKLIDFSILIDKDLFPQYKRRLVDAISPILNTFNLNETKQTMEISVDKVWEQIQAKDEGAFLQLIDVFCFLKPTETLIFIQNEIRNYDSQKIPFDDIKFEKNSISSLPKFLSALSQFRHYREDDMNISLDLFLQTRHFLTLSILC
jgi:DNA polymerase III delta prime subunit